MWEKLAALVDRGDTAGVVAELRPLDEAARKKLAKRARALAKDLEQRSLTAGWQKYARRRNAAESLVFGTGGAAAAARQDWFTWQSDEDARYELVQQRPREWGQDWAERVLEIPETGERVWRLVHRLVREGKMDRLQTAGYLRHAVIGFYEFDAPSRWPMRARRPLAEILREEHAWLEVDLWRLLAIEESNLTARAAWKVEGEQSWIDALVELSAEGRIDRQRLLDASLAALRSDFSPYNARWHQQLHNALDPTLDEHAARVADLLALLAAQDAALVGFSLRLLGKLEKARRMPEAEFLDAVAPALLHPVKAHATRAAKLVGRVLKRSPGAAPVILDVLVDALGHEAREVQEAVLAVLERHAGALAAQQRERIGGTAELLDPAVRARAAALAGEAPPAEPAVAEGPAVDVPPMRTLSRLAPRLAGLAPLAPIETVDELLDRAAVAIERADDPDENELILDAVSRLRREPVDPARREALGSRCGDRTFAWKGKVELSNGHDPLTVALQRWIGYGDKLTVPVRGTRATDALAQRVRELMEDIGGPPRPLLGVPSHQGGWIDPHEAVRRVAALEGARPLVCDLAQMVMRLAPDGRDEARAAAAELPGEAARVLVRALGGDARKPFLSKLKLAWAAADDARDPDGHVPHAVELPESKPADHWFGDGVTGQKNNPEPPATLLSGRSAWWGWEATRLEPWLATVWPANREGLFHIAARRLWHDTSGAADRGIGDILELLLDPAEPVGPHAATAVALGLGTGDVENRTLAADAAIAVLANRRLDGATLGARLAWLLRAHSGSVPSRWAPGLEGVAATGPLHAHDVQAAIETVLAAARDEDRRRLLALVELLRRLAVDAGAAVGDPAARAWLEAISGSSKIARAAREALAVRGDGAARSRAAAAEVSGGGSPGAAEPARPAPAAS